jgi:hypothetical protein
MVNNSAAGLAAAGTMNTDWTQHPHFAALDWADGHTTFAAVPGRF